MNNMILYTGKLRCAYYWRVVVWVITVTAGTQVKSSAEREPR